jgi:hypothetical protein
MIEPAPGRSRHACEWLKHPHPDLLLFGHGLPCRLRWRHDECTSDSRSICRAA